MSILIPKGVWTALITPFNSSGDIDFESFEKLVSRQIDAGVDGIIPFGTTGESPTLLKEEKRDLLKICVSKCKEKFTRVFAGTGTNDTQTTIKLTQMAAELGADGALVVTPYYNKPTQRGLIAHYQALSRAVDFPIMLYSVPSRTGVSILPQTLIELSGCPNLIALKDGSGNMQAADVLFQALHAQALQKRWSILSGDDTTLITFLQKGGSGIVSVASNLLPKTLLKICHTKDTALFESFLPLFKALFIETNPAPIKHVYSLYFGGTKQVRLPLVGLEPHSVQAMQEVLALLPNNPDNLGALP